MRHQSPVDVAPALAMECSRTNEALKSKSTAAGLSGLSVLMRMVISVLVDLLFMDEFLKVLSQCNSI